MFSVTLPQILLVPLSAYWQMYALSHYAFNDFPPAEFDKPASKCESNVEIVNWINEQIVRNAKLTGVNQRLSKILDTLNSSIYGKIPVEHCCFYENHTMEKIMQDLSNISTRNDIEINNPLVSTGDIGEDLDLILDRMRSVIGNRTLSCCDHLFDNLKTTESNLLTRLEDLRKELNDERAKIMGRADGFQQQQTNLESELRDITRRLHDLDNRQQNNAEEAAKCCKELNVRVDDFEKQLETAKAKSLETQIKDLSKTQDEHEIQLNNMTKITENNIEVVVKVTEDCKKIRGAVGESGANGSGIEISGIMTLEDNLMKRQHELEDKVSNITAEVARLQNISKSLTDCDKLNNDIAKLKETIEKLQENLPAPDYSSLTQLQQEIANARLCCKKFDMIANETMNLQEKIDQMNANYNNQSSTLESAFTDIQNQINNALQKLNEYVDASNSKNNKAIMAMDKRIQVLQSQVDGMVNMLDISKENIDDNKLKINELRDELEKKTTALSKLHENRIKAASTYKEEVELELNELYVEIDKCSANNDPELENCISEFRIKYNELRQMITKLLSVERKVSQLNRQLNDLTQKYKTNERKLVECAEKCQDMDKLNDLIDRIEELEKTSSPLLTTQAPQSTVTKKAYTAKKTTKQNGQRIAGMYGSVDNAIPFYT